jgi:hypothetical protein
MVKTNIRILYLFLPTLNLKDANVVQWPGDCYVTLQHNIFRNFQTFFPLIIGPLSGYNISDLYSICI